MKQPSRLDVQSKAILTQLTNIHEVDPDEAMEAAFAHVRGGNLYLASVAEGEGYRLILAGMVRLMLEDAAKVEKVRKEVAATEGEAKAK